ncbi:MAG: hypothetical protein KJ847_00100 [Firmicutes bacterium]|nr:hypothetical protein [Bacillota bacterium]
MKKIIHFIDYFPGENSFVIPVFSDDNKQNYVQIVDESSNIKMVNLIMESSITEYSKEKKTNMKERKIQAYEHILIENISYDRTERISAFKFNTDLILIGKTDALLEKIVSYIGTMSGSFAMFDEIIAIILRRNSDLNVIAKNIRRSLEMYKEYNYIDFSIDQLKNLKVDYSNQNDVQVIKNRRELTELDPISIMFRKIYRSSKMSKSINFDDEIERIENFKDILIKEIMKREDLLNFTHLFE